MYLCNNINTVKKGKKILKIFYAMKKVSLVIVMMLFFTFFSCKKSNDRVDDVVNEGYCWEFTITTKCTDVDDVIGSIEKCNLTEIQAEEVRKELESTYTLQGVTCTTTATKKKQ